MGESTAGESTAGASNSTTAVRQGRDILELPVYTIAEGKSVGTIDTLFVRRENLSVPWVQLKTGPLGGHAFAPYAAFQTVGVDVALLPNEAALQDALPREEKDALSTGLTGRPVLTPGGEQVGSLVGFQIDTASGSITSFHVRAAAAFFRHVLASVRDDTVLVPSDEVVSLGPDALIIGQAAVETLFPSSQEAAASAAA